MKGTHATGAARPARATPKSKPGILIVDDEPMVGNLVQFVAECQGLAVWPAANGHEALRLYADHHDEIAGALLDVRMPGLDGPETLAALHSMAPTMLCCFMTGDAGAYTEGELLQRGAARVFAKPLALADLRTFLRQVATRGSVAGS